MKIDVVDIIYQSFVERSIKDFDSYGSLLIVREKEDEFEGKLSDDLKKEFMNLMDSYCFYHAEYEREFCDYIFGFIRNIIKG